MATYHFSAKIIARSNGRSAVAAAAYRSRSILYDRRRSLTFDYTYRRDLVHSEILLPENAPHRFADRSTLWNEAEAMERRKDAQVAREIEIALPIGLSLEENVHLVRRFARKNFIDQGMIADINVHNKENNPHAHILLTLRIITTEGFGEKLRQWNGNSILVRWRQEWAKIQNENVFCVDLAPQRVRP